MMSYLQQNVHRACRVGPREACLVCFLSPHYTTLCRQHHRRQCIVPDHFVPYQVSDDGVRYGTACAVPCCVLRVGGRPCVWRLGLCPLVVFGYFVHWGGGVSIKQPGPLPGYGTARAFYVSLGAPRPSLAAFFPAHTLALTHAHHHLDYLARAPRRRCRYRLPLPMPLLPLLLLPLLLLLLLLPVDATAAAVAADRCHCCCYYGRLPIDVTAAAAAAAVAVAADRCHCYDCCRCHCLRLLPLTPLLWLPVPLPGMLLLLRLPIDATVTTTTADRCHCRRRRR